MAITCVMRFTDGETIKWEVRDVRKGYFLVLDSGSENQDKGAAADVDLTDAVEAALETAGVAEPAA